MSEVSYINIHNSNEPTLDLHVKGLCELILTLNEVKGKHPPHLYRFSLTTEHLTTKILRNISLSKMYARIYLGLFKNFCSYYIYGEGDTPENIKKVKKQEEIVKKSDCVKSPDRRIGE